MDEDQYCCHRCYCERCGSKHENGFCSKCNLYVNLNSFNNYDPRMNFLDNPSNDIRDQKALDTMQTWCEFSIQQKVKEKQEEKNIAEKAADHRTHTPVFLDSFKLTYKKSTIPFNNTPHSPDFSDFPPQPQYQTNSLIQQHEQAVQKKQEEQNSSNAITPDLSTEEPDNSLSMGDEHLDTIPEIESDEVIKSSVEDLVLIPSDSEGIFDNMCDVPFCDKNHFYAKYDLLESLLNRDTSIVYSPKIDSLLEEFTGELAPINPIPLGIHEADFDPEGDIRLIEQLLYNDYASSDDDPLYSEDIDYIEASPPDSELVSLEEVKNDILREKLLNIYLLIVKIESLNDNPTPDCLLKSPSPFPIPVEDSDSFFKKSNTSLSYSDNSLPEFKTFSDHTEETSSGSTTTHADNSLPEYDSFLFETEPDQGELTSVVMEDILGEPHVPNVFTTHPTLYLDLDFAPFDDSLEPNLVVSFPSRTRNRIFDLGIFREV
ncbi:hypothetical protein Tco_0268015 [Tanacetum coccineum]